MLIFINYSITNNFIFSFEILIMEDSVMAGRFEGLNDGQWAVLEHLLPPEPEKRKRGMPHASFRCVLNTIFYILITGARWCDIPSGKSVFGSRSASLTGGLSGGQKTEPCTAFAMAYVSWRI